jgi:hypothetical protein
MHPHIENVLADGVYELVEPAAELKPDQPIAAPADLPPLSKVSTVFANLIRVLSLWLVHLIS